MTTSTVTESKKPLEGEPQMTTSTVTESKKPVEGAADDNIHKQRKQETRGR